MRLFIAINFNAKTKNNIIAVQSKLKDYAKGSFSRTEYIHLTLVFLGEIAPSKLKIIKQIMEDVFIPKIELTFDHTGFFKKREGDIWWIGLKNNQKLVNLQKELNERLISAGFKLEQRTYRPHITLARRVKPYNPIDKSLLLDSHFSTQTDAISLMLSERKDGKLVYTELHKVT